MQCSPSLLLPYSPNEVINMQTQIEQALAAGAETGVVTLQITESQLTSYMTEKMMAQVDPPFTDPQVLLRNGQMLMYGKVTQGFFNANILITMNISIDELTGLPKIEIASADFGPLPAPEGINTAMNAINNEAFTGSQWLASQGCADHRARPDFQGRLPGPAQFAGHRRDPGTRVLWRAGAGA